LQEDNSLGVDSWLKGYTGEATHARVFGDLHRADPVAADRLAEGLVRMPEVGTEFVGFRLLAELGRGAFGRVFLAEQAALANRLVALKVAPDAGGESQKLAQLQHTHIVPVYSLHRAGPLQAVCMPFFGALTLADVLRDVMARPSLPLSGKELLSTLNERQSQVTIQTRRQGDKETRRQEDEGSASAVSLSPCLLVSLSGRGSAEATLKKLQGLSYVEGVVWLGSCLADGLGHAHERGIFHRDLKPANVLRPHWSVERCPTWPPSTSKPSPAARAPSMAAATSSGWAFSSMSC
jgi:serine/threonine protein kinase